MAHMVHKLGHLTINEIAANVTLRQAIAVTTPRPQDRPERMRDALHEAAHMVAAAYFGIRTAHIYIPRRNSKGEPIKHSHWFGWGNATMATDRLSPANPYDVVTCLELAIVDLVGEVAEAVSAESPNPPTFSGETTDLDEARYRVRTFGEAMDRVLARRPDLGEPCANVFASRFDAMKKNAIFVFSSNHSLIDAAAAIVLLRAPAHGGLMFPHDLSDWIRNQTMLPAYGRECAERECEYPYPAWMASSPVRRTSNFYGMRRALAEIEAGLI